MATVYDIQSFNTTTTLLDLGGTATEGPAIQGGGRVSGNRMYNSNGNNDVWNKDSVTAANPVTSALGFAFYFTHPPAVGPTPVGSITDAGQRQCEWGINSSGLVVIMRSGTVLATGAFLMPTLGWHYVELKVTVNNSTGSFEWRLNGETRMTGSSLDTQQSANAFANGYRIGQLGDGQSDIGDSLFDDLYYASDFLGDIRVDSLYPTAEGNTTMFSASTGIDNALVVDETPPNSDTDYVSAPNVNDKDTYITENLPSSPATVHAVKTKLWAKKTDAAARTVYPVVRHSSTDYDGSAKTLTTSYAYHDELYNTNPGTAAAWVDTDVDAAEFGVKIAT